MFLKKSKYSNGRTFLSIMQSYRDENGKPKHRTIEKIGFLDELESKYDDPISYFSNQIKNGDFYNDELIIKHLSTCKIDSSSKPKSVGVLPIAKVYNKFNLAGIFNKYQNKYDFKYSLESVLELLVFSRILKPASKFETYKNRSDYFDNYNFSLKDMYRALDHLPNLKQDILTEIWKNTSKDYNRDLSTTYYDCTNYYFEISYNDEDLIDEFGNILEKGYRKKGPSKEHRKSPIIQMGLLMDKSGIPLTYDLFAGNESEKTSLRPIINSAKKNFGAGRTIVVADRGLNTSDNTWFLAGKNDNNTHLDGYVYGQSVRAGSEEFKDWILDQKDYSIDKISEKGKTIYFKHKSRLFSKDITLTRDGKRKNKTNTYEKQMVYYSSKYAKKQQKERQIAIEKSKDLIKHPGKYNKATSYGCTKYISNINFVKDTGEIANINELTLNQKMIEEEAKFDGYYCIVTSEKELSDIQIRNIYKGLWKIEETFKITKSNLSTRPIYVWTKEHIESHFLTCFIALVIIRLLEVKLENKFSCKEIIKSLSSYNCSKVKGEYFMFNYYDDCIDAFANHYNVVLNDQFKTISQIKKILKN